MSTSRFNAVETQAIFDRVNVESTPRYSDYVLAGMRMDEMATEVKDAKGITAAGPYYALAVDYFMGAMITKPPTKGYDPFTQDESEDPIDPIILLQHGTVLAKQLEAWYMRPYNIDPITAHPDTLDLTIVDRRNHLQRVASNSLTQAWEGINKNPAELEDIGMTGILAADGFVSLGRTKRASDIAEQTDAILEAHDEDTGSWTLEEFKRINKPPLVVVEEMASRVVFELGRTVEMALAV